MKRSFQSGVLLVILLVVSFNVFAQVSPYSIPPKWMFGYGGGMDFSGGASVLLTGNPTSPGNPNALEHSTAMCDSSGNLVFYTNTSVIYDGATHTVLRDMNAVDGVSANSSTGGAIAVPDPADPFNQFYLFIANDLTAGANPNQGIHYYTISRTGPSVTSGPIQIATGPQVDESIAAGADGKGGYWIVSHAQGAAELWVWHVTASGITGPVQQTTNGFAVSGTANGTIKFSQCQTRIAWTGNQSLVAYEWDHENGTIGATPIYNSGVFGMGHISYGLEFSPDGSKLYHSVLNAPRLRQVDIGSGTIIAPDLSTSSSNTGINEIGTMQLGPDGKIYVTNAAFNPTGDVYVGVINDPNSLTPNYVDDGFTLSTDGSRWTFRGIANEPWLNPTLDIDTSITCLDATFSLDFLTYFRQDITTGSITWDFGDGNNSSSPNPTHSYATAGAYQVILTVTDALCGHTFRDTIDIVVQDCGCTKSDAEVTAPTASYCEDDSLRLSAIPQDPSLTYQWVLSGSGNIPGATDTFYYATSPGDYAVTITNACGDSTSLFFTVTENPKPLAPTIVGTTPVCPGDSGGYKVPTGFASYTWGVPGATTLLNGQGTDTITVEYASTAGDITLVVTNGFGCPSDEASLTVTMSSFPAAPVIVGKDLICPGQQDVGYEIQSPAGGSTYNWNITGGAIDFSGNDTISVDYGSIAPFTVEVSETNSSGCSSPVAQLNVDPFAVAVNSSGGPGCLGQNTIALTASTNGTIDSIRWYYNGVMVPDILGGNVNPLQAGLSGNYNAIVYDISVPCADSAATTTNLTFNLPPTSNIGPLPGTDTMTINLGETVNLTGTPGGGTSPYNTVWLELASGSTNTLDTKTGITSPVDLNGLLPFDEDNIVEYVFNVTDNNGCFATDTMRITVLQVDILIPNIITPNGDNSNQTFEIVGILPGSTVAIFNRWGKQIYMNENYDNTWQADEQSDGIYYVNIKMGITEEEYKGWVYVVR